MTTKELATVTSLILAATTGGTVLGTAITDTSIQVVKDGFSLDTTEAEINAIDGCLKDRQGTVISMTRGIAEQPILTEPKPVYDDKGEAVLDEDGKPKMAPERTGTLEVSTIAGSFCQDDKCDTFDFRQDEVTCIDAILDKGPQGAKWAFWELSQDASAPEIKPVLEDGKPVLDENGQPKTEIVMRKILSGQVRFGEYTTIAEPEKGKPYRKVGP